MKHIKGVLIAFALVCVINCNFQNAENKKETSITQNKNSKEMEKNKDNVHDNLKNYVPIKQLNIKEFNAKHKHL